MTHFCGGSFRFGSRSADRPDGLPARTRVAASRIRQGPLRVDCCYWSSLKAAVGRKSRPSEHSWRGAVNGAVRKPEWQPLPKAGSVGVEFRVLLLRSRRVSANRRMLRDRCAKSACGFFAATFGSTRIRPQTSTASSLVSALASRASAVRFVAGSGFARSTCSCSRPCSSRMG
jgi:hypothetical protein